MKTLTVRFSDSLYDLLISYSRKRGTELQHLFEQYAKSLVWEEKKKEAVAAYREEKLTLREIADLLGLTYREADELMEKENVPIIR